MSINLEIRLNQLENLNNYITSSKEKICSLLESLKWNKDEVLKESHLIRCSVDHNHRVPTKSMEDHIVSCSLRKEGYDLNEDFLSEPLKPSKSSIYLDDQKKIEILSAARKNKPGFKTRWNGHDPDPKTSDRNLCTYSPDERLALYSYAMVNTIGPQTIPEFNTTQKVIHNKPLTYEEMLIQERDAKRRRLKYKSVHTNRKNHTEVIREVINGQMEMYKDWLLGKEEANSKSDYESCEKSKSNRSSIERYSEHSHSGISRVSANSSRDERNDISRKRHREDGSRDKLRSRHTRYKHDRHRDRKTHKSRSRDHKSPRSR